MKAKRTDCSGGYIFFFPPMAESIDLEMEEIQWSHRISRVGIGGNPVLCGPLPEPSLSDGLTQREQSRQSSFSLFGNSLHFRGISERQPVAPFEATEEKIVKMCNAVSPNL